MSRLPINDGHVIVVPRAHYEDFYVIDTGVYTELFLVARQIASAIAEIYKPRKVGLLAAGFDVDHVHVHVLPMHDYHDITSRAILDGTLVQAAQSELEREASVIRSVLDENSTA